MLELILRAYNNKYRVTVTEAESDRGEHLLLTLKKNPQFKTDAQRLNAAKARPELFVVSLVS